MAKDDIIGGWVVDNKKSEQLCSLPWVLVDCDGKIDGADEGDPVANETDQRGSERRQTFLPNFELAKAVEKDDV